MYVLYYARAKATTSTESVFANPVGRGKNAISGLFNRDNQYDEDNEDDEDNDDDVKDDVDDDL